MSRRPRAALLAALVAVLTLAPVAPEWSGGGGRAGAADCVWQRHDKRVFKRVKRHGKVRRVSRVAHSWSCEPAAAQPPASTPAPSPPAPTPSPAPQPTPQPEPEPEAANRLSVKSAEYTYTLSRPSVSAGEVTIELNNMGEDPHNLNLQREGGGDPPLEIAETDSQQQQTATFALAAGTYRLWCSLPAHDEKGMHATLVVAGE